MEERFFIAEEACKRLDLFLSARLEETTRSAIKKLIDDGNVTLDGKKAKAGESVKKGAAIAVFFPELLYQQSLSFSQKRGIGFDFTLVKFTVVNF